MSDEIPLIVEKEGNVLTLSLNNVEKRNALTSEMMGALSAILEDVNNYDNLRVIVIRGSGSVFCSGADINTWNREELQELLSRDDNESEASDVFSVDGVVTGCPTTSGLVEYDLASSSRAAECGEAGPHHCFEDLPFLPPFFEAPLEPPLSVNDLGLGLSHTMPGQLLPWS